MAGFWGWLERKAPGLHRFLTRNDRPWPIVREAAALVLLVLILVAALWGGTGQRFGERPVVVVESGSMMHCENGYQALPRQCQGDRYGRFGTIDPGDLIFVRDVDGRGAIDTAAEGGRERYGAAGDVIVFRPNGEAKRTPIIHRALFWLEIHPATSGTPKQYSVPELGLHRVDVTELTRNERVQQLSGHSSFQFIQDACEVSGFVTRGDNNPQMDQAGGQLGCPIRSHWILGKARGEVPWIGLVNLKFNDMLAKPATNNYANAPSDVKAMMWATILLVVGGPIVLDAAARRRGDDEAEPAGDKA
ncbi:MAG TPA: S26 family signal peptidase [Candidatus Thermoplasmatota archaeon]|nr:S26 family signal peptidase [Candidatus Thermoplasmatota archaeon]